MHSHEVVQQGCTPKMNLIRTNEEIDAKLSLDLNGERHPDEGIFGSFAGSSS